MREFLEDALEHRDDGYGRAQKHVQRTLAKRFYKETGVAEMDGGFAITLDGKPTRTPGRVPVRVPVREMAEIMAAEWGALEKLIDPDFMPHVRLVNSAIEGGEGVLANLKAEVLKYAAGDLMYYRAETPRELIAEQAKHWDAALAALSAHFDVTFKTTSSLIHEQQSEQTLEVLQQSLESVGLFGATAMASITSLTGSGLLAIALRNELLSPEAVWAAGHVDEDFNVRLWGEDHEAVHRRAKRRIEFDAAVTVLKLAGDQ